jgi:hypothetical protein
MDAQRPGDEMTDAALDRELQAMLGVDPSPEFVARVRTRVAGLPAPARPWPGGWTLAASLAAAVAIAFVTSGVLREAAPRREANPPREANRTRVADPAREATPHRDAPPTRESNRTRDAGSTREARMKAPRVDSDVRGAATSAPPATTEPDILVDPREAAALRAFFERARSGEVELTAIVAPSASPLVDPTRVDDIYIAPIAFDPVIDGAAEKGVRQ